MSSVRRHLVPGEQVELEVHPHWRTLVRPVLVLLLVVPAASYGAARIPDGADQPTLRWVVAGVAVALLVLFALVPYLRWVTTWVVVTDLRLLTRRGVVSQSGRDIPLRRINDVSTTRTLGQRLLGCGTLVVESAGERGQVVLTDLPRVNRVQRLLAELLEDQHRDRLDGDDDEERGDEPDEWGQTPDAGRH